MARESKVAVLGALGANLAIAVTKFVGAAITGSSAMLSEGIHSAVDTGNQVLMLIGIQRSHRPPDSAHRFGHGKELYFWSFLVAVFIFGAGGGISAYEGILHMLHPVPMTNPKWNYVVLACAFVFEGISLGIALRAFSRRKGSSNLWVKLVNSKDPTIYTVIAEDSAALAGVTVAFAGVFLSHELNMPVLDGAASVVIGALLAGVALFLIRECRGLLVGEAVDPAESKRIREIATSVDGVLEAAEPLTMYLGPSEVLLILGVRLRAEARAPDVLRAIHDIESRVRQKYPIISRIYVEVQSAKEVRAGGALLAPGPAEDTDASAATHRSNERAAKEDSHAS